MTINAAIECLQTAHRRQEAVAEHTFLKRCRANEQIDHKPRLQSANEPELRGMSTALDLDAETGTPAKIPGEGEETVGALGDFA